MKSSIFYTIHLLCLSLLGTLFFIDCKKKTPDVDIQDCDAIYNYYKDGTHYIRRDLVTEDGVLDYDKLLEDGKIKNSNCYPAKDKEMNTDIELEERRTLR